MKKALLCLFLLAGVVSASANDNPAVNITPSPIALPPRGSQQLTAAFSDGSRVQSCSWLATGPQKAIASTSASTAEFAAGTSKATYVVTANCVNTNGVPAMGLAVVSITLERGDKR
jgi:hypothetical protein